jgi:hypothetical protein
LACFQQLIQLASIRLWLRVKVQREGSVVHLIVEHLRDLTSDLKKIAGLTRRFPWSQAAGTKQSSPTGYSRNGKALSAKVRQHLV